MNVQDRTNITRDKIRNGIGLLLLALLALKELNIISDQFSRRGVVIGVCLLNLDVIFNMKKDMLKQRVKSAILFLTTVVTLLLYFIR